MAIYYMVTFTINIPQMLAYKAYIPYMDMGSTENRTALRTFAEARAQMASVTALLAESTSAMRLVNSCGWGSRWKYGKMEENGDFTSKKMEKTEELT